MLSSAGLSGGTTAKPKASMVLAPPPGATGKLRNPLPPPPNDPAAARMNSGQNAGMRAPKESTKRNSDPFSDLSAIKQTLPSSTEQGQTKSTGAGWAAF
uniref:Uncharacterized protein n=1 Tax=Arundo donax TaxID=35708 RepID=A0A0A9DYD3_ARUDO